MEGRSDSVLLVADVHRVSGGPIATVAKYVESAVATGDVPNG